MPDFDGDTDLTAFRLEARTWLKANFPASLAADPGAAARLAEGPEAQGDAKLWKSRMADKGWGAPGWPREYGGGGLSPSAVRILQQEMAQLGAYNPMSPGMGLTMVGPTLLEYGTEDQKRRHVTKIARGQSRWCLGYSEPGAGSDLASLATKAQDAGDHFVINGQKIWTSGAQYSDWCGLLARTDPEAKKHDGISFLLVDMRQGGVETRPIKLISGDSPFCETFFTDARAEKHELLGPLNGGWTVGKRLLQHERASQTGNRRIGPTTPLQDIALRYLGVDEDGRLADPDFRARLTAHLMDAEAHALTLARVAAESKGAANPSPATSVLKNSATAVAQARAELILEIMGLAGLGWGGDAFTDEELAAVRLWLGGKAMSIYGGSFEIQNNIIAKRVLGLPDMTKSS
jgi:alkylation response protein AidB-like acyl-CoA dehydrogenase